MRTVFGLLIFKMTGGHTAFDLRTMEPGHTVEVDTPNAAFTIDHAGYYRLNIAGEHTIVPAAAEAGAL